MSKKERGKRQLQGLGNYEIPFEVLSKMLEDKKQGRT
jgi:hypothetical protein